MHTEIFIFSMSNFLYFTITTYITLWGSTKYPLSFEKIGKEEEKQMKWVRKPHPIT